MKRFGLALLLASVCATSAFVQTKQEELPNVRPVMIRYAGSSYAALQIADRDLIKELGAEVSRFREVPAATSGPGPSIPPLFLSIEIEREAATKEVITIDKMCTIAHVEGKGLYYVRKDKSPLLVALVVVLDKDKRIAAGTADQRQDERAN